MSIDRNVQGAIAVTRFGLGARAGEIASAVGDPEGWLTGQIRSQGADQPRADAPGSAERFNEFRAYQKDRRDAKLSGEVKSDPVKMAAKMLRADTGADFLARMRLAATTEAGF
ncbi:MAG: DUF1800 domain-containing protein, partial [Caulobacteraceae bacterium]